MRHAIETGGRDDFPAVLAAIHATGALEHARRRARDEAGKAENAISQLPDSQYKKALLELAVFSVERSH